MKKLLLIILLTSSVNLLAQEAITIRGTVNSGNEPLSGISITLKDRSVATSTNSKGEFNLSVNGVKLPIVLVVSGLGYNSQEVIVNSVDNTLSVSLTASAIALNEVVSAATRVNQSILQSPVSIEKMTLKAINENPSFTFYDGLQSLKGMEVVTSGLTYKQVNTRGFNSTGNARFLQLVDGVDNQTPGLNFSVGNLFGASDLEIESAEVIPGAASALYGPAAFNGLLYIKTKDPFQYQGLTVQVKTGLNHIGESFADPKGLYDLGVRYARAFNDRLALKINASYLTGRDWYANDFTDVSALTPVGQRGPNNPGRDALHIYGDEVSRSLPGIGLVSRTGYEEKDLMNYDVYSLKLNGALHYKLSKGLEAIYQYNIGQGTASYTGSSRMNLNNFVLQTNRLELKGSNFFVRGYMVGETSNDSYNTRSLAQFINRDWVQDMSGKTVSPAAADDTWFSRYAAAFNGTAGVPAGSNAAARAFADQGRFVPGSEAFNNAKEASIHKYGLNGAGVFSKSKFYHADGQYDLSKSIKIFEFLVGGSLRQYKMFTNGSLFDDKTNKISIQEYGTFAQAGKKMLDNKLKLTASIRFDKNENFKGSFTPRFSGVYTVNHYHNFRASYQTGFRNPTPVDQFMYLNVGPITILGGAPNNSRGLNVYENSYTSASVNAFGSAVGAAISGGTAPPVAIANNKGLLVKSNVAYVKPEQQKAFEIGYKGLIQDKLLLDLNYYRSSYTDFILNTVVIQPASPVLAADGSVNAVAAGEVASRSVKAYQLYTNANDKVSADGVSLGLTYLLNQGYVLGGNITKSNFDLGNANKNNVAPFNTPEYSTNLTFGNSDFYKGYGFNLAWHWQSEFDWYASFNGMIPGRVDAYSMLDAQVNKKLASSGVTVKVGGSNILNKRINQAYGSPGIGAVYYVSLVFDRPFSSQK
jgi:iron complex outermembrane receptor protein